MFGKLMLLVVSFFFSLFFLEVCVRVLFPGYHPARQIVFHVNQDGVPLGPKNDTVRQRTPKGDFDLMITFNKYGFSDYKDLKDSMVSDWFVLGDSFGLGWGVEVADRFSDVLDALAPFKVYNISIPTDFIGYQQLRDYAEHNGAIISNLIISVCMENDLFEYSSRMVSFPRQKSILSGRLRAYAKSHSALYLALSYELQKVSFLRHILEYIGISRRYDSGELLNKNEFNGKEILAAAKLLKTIVDKQPNTVVLIIPSRGLWVGTNQRNETAVHDSFIEALSRLHLNVVDMRPIFESAGNPMMFYFETDPHWNSHGHRVAGEALWRWIQSYKTSKLK